ncbi:MAG: HU family DNA-binding protein [Phycisphaerales bacterium]|nr:HU family DNA-binding protein [Phycisphaerales bacterium]
MARTTTRKRTTKRPAAKKRSTKRTTSKRTTTRRKTTAAKPAVKIAASRDVRSKSQVYTTLAEATGVAKKDVAAVFDAMAAMIGADLKNGSGEFRVPGMMKIVVQKKPATKARKGVNPFTGETMMFKAKPARKVVKVRPLKGLKEMV